MSPRHAPARFNPPRFSEIEAQRIRYKTAHRAPLTVISYQRDWRVFRTWCEAAQRPPLPACTDTVELYIVDLIGQGRKISTLKRHLVAIQHYHRAAGLESPNGASVRQLLAGAQRILCQRPDQKAALGSAELRRIAPALGRDTAIGARDSAILLFGFASALRRSSLARLELDDLTFGQAGVLVRVLREKQDRTGEGRVASVKRGRRRVTCPVRALEDWLAFRGAAPGPLFCHVMRGKPILKPLLGNRIGQIIQGAVERIGLDPATYGAHSLRAGCVTEALSNGADAILVARHTAHASLDTVKLYMRQRDPWRGHIGKFLNL